jgi:hypothetical protein
MSLLYVKYICIYLCNILFIPEAFVKKMIEDPSTGEPRLHTVARLTKGHSFGVSPRPPEISLWLTMYTRYF